MVEFYDEVFDTGEIDYDIDIIYPDGSKKEMFLSVMPKVGDKIFGCIVNKIIINENCKENECFARIELKRKEELKK